MRTKLQKLYDRIYYGTEINYTNVWRVHWCRQALRKISVPSDFYRKFREKVVPYWRQYGIHVKPCWYKMTYYLTGEVDPRYIPDDIHHKYIVPYFDDVVDIRVLEDKNLHSLLLPNVKRPETVFKRLRDGFWNDDFTPITREEAYARCANPGRYIIKPSRDTGEGLDISFFSSEDGVEACEKLLRSYEGIEFIVQRAIVQHPALSYLNPTSVNTFRVVTMVKDGEVSILSAILRIGGERSLLDNISRGGYQAVIRPDGTLDKMAFTHRNNIQTHVDRTDAGVVFEGYQLPSWDLLCDTVKQLALQLPHLKLLGWDLAVDELGDVILIEYNSDFGQNQENCGPTFGERTEEILDLVFHKKRGA